MTEQANIPPYQDALDAMHHGDDEIVKLAILAFEMDDGEYLAQVMGAVRDLLKRADLTPRQIMSIGRALHGLNRLPLRTPRLSIQISLRIKNDSGAESYDLILDESGFETTSGGYVNFGYGSDSFSGVTFRVEQNYRGVEGWHFGAFEWPLAFSSMTGAQLVIDDESDDSLLDWEHPDGSLFWEWIDQHA